MRCEVPTPDQHGTILIDGKLARLDDFCLQILKVRIIKPKLPLESPIRDPLITLEEFEYLIEYRIEIHAQSLTPSGVCIRECNGLEGILIQIRQAQP
jgi:hypothetical protein